MLLYFNDVSNFHPKVVQKVAKNLISRSETMKLDTQAILQSLKRITLPHVVRWKYYRRNMKNLSTIMKIESTPFSMQGSLNTKSLLKSSQLSLGTGKDVYKSVFYACPLETWQIGQLLILVAKSFLNYGQ